MKPTALVLLSSIICFSAAAQEVSDSVSTVKALEEVTVQATPVIRKTDRDVYAISDDVKKRSSSAFSLLTNIGIPSVSVNDIMRKITVNGKDAEIRINGRKADINQFYAIPVENIRRIEFIDNPGLKYDGAVAVINVVIVNPDRGGSLSLSDMQAFNYGWNNANLSATIEHGKSQFNVRGFGNIRNNVPIFRDYNDRYALPDGNIVERTETPVRGHFKNIGIYPSVDYNYYVPDKTNVYVSAYFPMNFGQELLYMGDLTTHGVAGSTRLTDRQKGPNRNQQLSAYVEQKLPHDQTIMANVGWGRSTGTSRRIYSEAPDARATGDELHIDNNIHNRRTSWSAETDYTKTWNRNILTAGVRYSGSVNRAHYLYDTAPTVTVRQTTDRLYFFGEYSLQAGKWNVTAGAAGTWQDNATEGKHVSKLHFTPRLSVAWRYNDISRWSFTLSSMTLSPSVSETSPIVQQVDGFIIQQGNPSLKSYVSYKSRLRYGFAFGQRFSGSISTSFQHSPDPVQEYYTWSGDKILHTWNNSGYASYFETTFSPRWECIPGWATISGSVTFSRSWTKGHNYRHNLSNWSGNIDATFYHWGFDATLQYERGIAYQLGERIERGESYTICQVGYSWKDWRFAFGLFNPIGRYSQETTVSSALVKQKTVMRTTACDRMPFLQISYNISWGRQTRHASRKLESDLSGSGASAAGR